MHIAKEERSLFHSIFAAIGGEKKREFIDALTNPLFGFMVVTVDEAIQCGLVAKKHGLCQRTGGCLMGSTQALQQLHAAVVVASIDEVKRRSFPHDEEACLDIATLASQLIESQRRLVSFGGDESPAPLRDFRDHVLPTIVEGQLENERNQQTTFYLRLVRTQGFAQQWFYYGDAIPEWYDVRDMQARYGYMPRITTQH